MPGATTDAASGRIERAAERLLDRLPRQAARPQQHHATIEAADNGRFHTRRD